MLAKGAAMAQNGEYLGIIFIKYLLIIKTKEEWLYFTKVKIWTKRGSYVAFASH